MERYPSSLAGGQPTPSTPSRIRGGPRQTGLSTEEGALTFKTRVSAYYDHTLYGDLQPRGLAAGSDRNDAIEFVSSLVGFPRGVTCRTVANGVATETEVLLDRTVGNCSVYRIVAEANQADFFVNGSWVATHRTNIPTAFLQSLLQHAGRRGRQRVPERRLGVLLETGELIGAGVGSRLHAGVEAR